MSICITPNSIKVFSKLVNQKINLDNDTKGPELLKDLYSFALDQLSDNNLPKERNEEIVLQHLSIAPQLIKSKLSDTPSIKNKPLEEYVTKLADNVLKAIDDEASFQKVINDLSTELFGSKTIVVSVPFNAVAFTPFKTNNQEAVYNPVTGYSDNITDAKRKFEFSVLRSILGNGKNANSDKISFERLQVFLKKDLPKLPVGSNYVNIEELNSEDIVLLLVSATGEIIQFDKNIDVVESNGQVPVFTVSENTKFKEDFYKNQNEKNVVEKVKEFQQNIKDIREALNQGKEVIVSIDKSQSSKGFVATDSSRQTPLNQLNNIDDLQIEYEQAKTYFRFYIYPENLEKSFAIFGKPLSTMSEKDLEILHYLLTAKELRVKKNEEYVEKESARQGFLNFFVSTGDIEFIRPKAKNKKGETTEKEKAKIRYKIGDNKYEEINVDELTVEKLKEIINNKWLVLSNNANTFDKNNALRNRDAAKVGELYFDGKNYYRVEGIRYHSGLGSKSKNGINTKINGGNQIIGLINGVLQVEPTGTYTVREHVIKNFYTTLVPTAENNLTTVGAYLAFNPYVKPLDIEPIKFSSIGANNASRIQNTQQEKDALDWWAKSPLSSVVGVEFLNRLSEFGPNYLAAFINGSIELYKGSSNTELYHEAFHAYFDGILSQKERDNIYNTLRKNPGYFKTTVNGQTKVVAFSLATEIELEEYLAESFRDFALSNGKKTSFSNNKIVAFFQKLFNILKATFSNMSYAEARALNKSNGMVDSLFKTLYKGEFSAKDFSLLNAEAKYKSTELEIEGGDNFSLEEVNLAMTSMQAIMSDFIKYGLNSSRNLDTVKQITALLLATKNPNLEKNKREEYQKQLREYLQTNNPSGNGIFLLNSNTTLLNYLVDFIKNNFEIRLNEVNEAIKINNEEQNEAIKLTNSFVLKKQKEVLEKVLKEKNFGKISDVETLKAEKALGNDATPSSLISLFFVNYSNLFAENEFVETPTNEISEEEFIPLWDRTGNEQAFDETIEKGTVAILETIIAYDKQGTGEMLLNPLGFPKLLPVKNVIAKIAKKLVNIQSATDMSARLKELAKKDKELEQVLFALGDISSADLAVNATRQEQQQWTNFQQSFNKATVLLRELIIEQEIKTTVTEEDELKESSTISYKSGKPASLADTIIREWSTEFLNSTVTGPYASTVKNIKPGEPDIQVLDLQLFIEDERWDTLEKLLDSKNKTVRVEFLNALGINVVNDEDLDNVVLNGSSFFNYDSAGLRYLYQVIQKRIKEADSNLAKRGLAYVKNLEDLFSSFQYQDGGKTLTQESLSGYLKKWAEMHLFYSDYYTNFSAYNASGDLQSEKTYNSSLLNAVYVLNKVKTLRELIETPGFEHYDPRINPIVLGSDWFVKMFNLDGKQMNDKLLDAPKNSTIKINVENLSGSKLNVNRVGYKNAEGEFVSGFSSEKGIASISLNEIDKFVTDLHLTLNDTQEILRSEAKSTSLTVFAKLEKNPILEPSFLNKAFSENYNELDVVYQKFKHTLIAELIRINNIKKLKTLILNGEIETKNLAVDVNYLNRGEDFIVFDAILTKETKAELLNLGISNAYNKNGYSSDVDIPIGLKRKVQEQLLNYFKDRASNLKKEMADNVVIADSILEKYSNQKIEDVEQRKSNALDNIFRAHVLNNFYNNLNYSNLFLGDPANIDIEKGDFHKRIAGYISSGKIFRNDFVWKNFINSAEYNAFGFANKHNQTTSNKRIYNGKLRTAVINEARSNSVYSKHYQEILGIDSSKYDGGNKKEMQEADGQGYISFDAYRILQDSIGEWSNKQEKVYQEMLAGKEFTEDFLNATFPIRKFQYYGDVKNPESQELLSNLGIDINNVAFHKYSLFPLVPALIKNTPLQKLHEKMMEQSIDYVTMVSGSKLSTLSRVEVIENDKGQKTFSPVYDDFYSTDKRGEVNEDLSFTVNEIDVTYLKSQNYIAEGYNGYITLPTQIKKVILVGLLDGGVPVDFKYTGSKTRKAAWEALTPKQKLEKSAKWKWYMDYVNTLNELEKKLKNDLLEDLEFKEVVKNGKVEYEGDSVKLANYLKAQLKSKELLPEEISYLIEADGSLKKDLSLSLISEKVEEIFVTLVDKKLRNLKVNGEALVQVSSTMFEPLKKSEEQKAAELKYGTNGLKFFFLQDENGNEVTNEDGKAIVTGMDIKISLQGDFKNLLYTKDENGASIAVYVKDENTGKTVLDYNASLANLNRAIKTKTWQDKYGSLIEIPGVRIPTQGPNSIVSAKVAEFLPEFAGPMIILPTEIVSQSGADFDIDKLFMMFKNIANYRGNVEEIVYDKSVTESYEELNEKRKFLEKQIQPLTTALTDVWNEYKEWMEAQAGVNTELKIEFEYAANSKKEIDELYEKKAEIFNNKNLSINQKIDLHKKIDSNINALKQFRKNQFDEINKKLSDFYNAQVANKEDKQTLKQAKHEEYRAKINQAQANLDNKENEIIAVQKRINGKTSKGLENQIFNLFNQRILMPDNIQNLVTPNTTDDVKPLADSAGEKIEKSFDKFKESKNESTTPDRKIIKTSIFDYRFNLGVHQENSVGKDALGVAAVTATFYALFTTFGASIQGLTKEQQEKVNKAFATLAGDKSTLINEKAAFEILEKYQNRKLKFVNSNGEPAYNLNEETNSINLGFIKNVENQSIADLISQLINGFVDVAKDPWVFNLQANKKNIPTILFMIMSGVSVPNVISMLNNPLVLEYNKELSYSSGLYARMKEEFTFDESKKSENVIEKLQKKYKEAYKNLIKKTTNFNVNIIANSAEDFKPNELAERLGQPVSERDWEVLAHFLQIEKLSEAVTNFTFLTKFDTEKMSSTSEAMARKNQTEQFLNTKIEDKLIPDSWFEEINNSPLGAFNNDDFIINLFNKFFSLRNHPKLIYKSLSLKNITGVKRTKLLSDFKNDFLWFLYQNAVYGADAYTTSPLEYKDGKPLILGKHYKFEKTDKVEGVVIDNETIFYNDNSFNAEKDLGEFMFVRKFFQNLPVREYVKFRAEYDALLQSSENLTDDQFKDKYSIFNAKYLYSINPNNYRTVVLIKVALYNTNNPLAMFDKDFGIGHIVSNMIAEHKLDAYTIFSDIKKDFSKAAQKINLFFPLIKDVVTASVYKENLEELKNHPNYFVSDFAKKFTHLAIMQVGLNKGAKYSMLALAEQDLFSKVIEQQIGLKRILQNLDEGESSILEQFFKIYNNKENRNAFYTKTRGRNYLVDSLDAKAITVQNKIGTNNITILPFNIEPTENQLELTPDMLMSKDDPVAYAKELKATSFVIRNEKMRHSNQKLLDKALSVLGIDNTGEIPNLKLISSVDKTGSLSLGNSTVQKMPHVIKDQTMAVSSNKAIGKETTPLNDKYQSSSKAYAEAVKNDLNNPNALASNSKSFEFNSEDRVWIFGSAITLNAYKGHAEQDFIQKVENTFESYHKKFIDKAIEAGVTNFFVGNASGIDQMAKDYLASKGFRQIVRFSTYGAYNEYVAESVFSKAEDKLYSVQDPVVDITKSLFNNMQDNTGVHGQNLVDLLKKNGLFDYLNTIDKKLFTEPDLSDSLGLSLGERMFYNEFLKTLGKIYGNTQISGQVGLKKNFSAFLKNTQGRIQIGSDIGTFSYNHLLAKSFMLMRKETIASAVVRQSSKPQSQTKKQLIKNEKGLIIVNNALSEEQTIKIVEDSKQFIEDTSFKQTGGSVSWGYGMQWIRTSALTTKQKEGVQIGKQISGQEVTQDMVDQLVAGIEPKKIKGLPLYVYTIYDKNGNRLPNIPSEIIDILLEQGIDVSQYDASYNSVYDKNDKGSLIVHQDNTEFNTSPIITVSLGRPMKFITYQLKDSNDYSFGTNAKNKYELILNTISNKLVSQKLAPELKRQKNFSGVETIAYGELTPGNLAKYAKMVGMESEALDVLANSIEKIEEHTLTNGAVLVFSKENRNVFHEIIFDKETDSLPMPNGFPELTINKAFTGLGYSDKMTKTKDYRVVLTLRKVTGTKELNIVDESKLIGTTQPQVPVSTTEGIEINSKQTGLGNDLTNVHYAINGKSKFDIKPSDTSLKNPHTVKLDPADGAVKWAINKGLKTYGDAYGESVEGWYKSNNAKLKGIPEGVEGDAYDMKLMVGLITDKLTQYPSLVSQITERGGLDFLDKSTHTMGTDRWSSKNPKNMFINALKQAYQNVTQLQVPVTSVKPIVKDLTRWSDISNTTNPYTDDGIVVTRISNTEEQFGNPFIGSQRRDKNNNLVKSKVDNITVFNTIDEADQAYRDWLMGVKHQNVQPSRREWILKQINEGKLDGKTLLYYKPMEVTNNDGTIVRGGYHSHADTLAEIVEELRGKTTTQPSVSQTEKQLIKNEKGLIIVNNALSKEQTIKIVEDSKQFIEDTSFKQTGGSVSWGYGMQWIRSASLTTKQKEGVQIGKQIGGQEVTQNMVDQLIAGVEPKNIKGLPLYVYTIYDKNGNRLPNIPSKIIDILLEQGIDVSQYDASYNSVYDKNDKGSLIVHQDNTEFNTSPIITVSLGRPMKFITYQLKDSNDYSFGTNRKNKYELTLNTISNKLVSQKLAPELKRQKNFSGVEAIAYGELTPGNLAKYAKMVGMESEALDVLANSIEKIEEHTLTNGAVLVFSKENRNVFHEIIFDKETDSLPMPSGFPELTINKAYTGLGHKDKMVNTKDYRVVLTLRKVNGTKELNIVDESKLIATQPIVATASKVIINTIESINYYDRTKENARLADVTIDFGVGTAGEAWTKIAVDKAKKGYIGIDALGGTLFMGVTNEMVNTIVRELNARKATTLNIAGMGIYNKALTSYTQKDVDAFVYELLNRVVNSPTLENKIVSVRTGGQTGFDEAGTKASMKLGLESIILSTKDFAFRTTNGEIRGKENLFKERFEEEILPGMEDSLPESQCGF